MQFPSLDRFGALDPAARANLAAATASFLGAPWKVGPAWDHDGVALCHGSTVFVVVPGGRFTMGATPRDFEEAAAVLDIDDAIEDWLREEVASAQPPHEVTVLPFLCAVELLAGEDDRPVVVERAEAVARARGLGFRLPSEAELEWLLREGGACSFSLHADRHAHDEELSSRFGLRDLTFGQWAEDDWHPSYVGAPEDSRPWKQGDALGVARAGFAMNLFTTDEDILGALACLRMRGDSGRFAVRLAASLAPPPDG